MATIEEPPVTIDGDKLNEFVFRAVDEVGATLNAALFAEITLISSFHDFTNDFAPSSWSCAARASTSMPAMSNVAMTSSQSPPSSGSNSPSSV